eukprot:8974796-Lingulodinium_polyedra.AAC.1
MPVAPRVEGDRLEASLGERRREACRPREELEREPTACRLSARPRLRGCGPRAAVRHCDGRSPLRLLQPACC